LKGPFAKFIEAELGSGILLIACGLPGSWKTETTEEVAKIKGYPLLLGTVDIPGWVAEQFKPQKDVVLENTYRQIKVNY